MNFCPIDVLIFFPWWPENLVKMKLYSWTEENNDGSNIWSLIKVDVFSLLNAAKSKDKDSVRFYGSDIFIHEKYFME